MAVKSELRGTLLCETRGWEVSDNRRAILPLIKAFEKKRGRAVKRATLYGQVQQMSKLAALKRAGEAKRRVAAAAGAAGAA